MRLLIATGTRRAGGEGLRDVRRCARRSPRCASLLALFDAP
jgi:hypothetical protein